MVVEGHVDAVAAAAEGDAARELTGAYGVGEWVCVVRVVAAVSGVSAEVDDLVAGGLESCFDSFFHFETSVVAGHTYLFLLHYKCHISVVKVTIF